MIKLKIKDKEVVCVFGLGFLGECLENLDLSVVEIGEKLDKNPFKWIPTLMYESTLYYNDGKLDFSKKDLIKWLDEDGTAGKQALNDFLQAFMSSLTKDVPKQEQVEVVEEQPKKK